MRPSWAESNAPVFGFPASFSSLKAAASGLVWMGVILVVACSQPGSGLNDQTSRHEPRQVEGLIVEVVDRDIDEVETLRIRDSGGKIWTFTTEGYAGVTPAHLREHQLFGDGVTVTYQEMDGPEGRVLVASEIAD